MTTLPYTAIVYGEWFTYERKRLKIEVLGDNVDLTGIALDFVLRTEPNGLIVLTKTDSSVTLSGTDIVNVDIGGVNDAQLEADYEDIEANWRSGVFWFELYDSDEKLKLAEGYATLGRGMMTGD